MAAPVAQHPLEQYESLEVIGNGSFGIIRKVRRKSDGVVSDILLPAACDPTLKCDTGQILARKELNFERMTERDRKQIVAEVLVNSTELCLMLTVWDRNILKDLCHENIVRYHDRVRSIYF